MKTKITATIGGVVTEVVIQSGDADLRASIASNVLSLLGNRMPQITSLEVKDIA